MNTKNLQICIEDLKTDLGEALLSTDIWGADGLSFAAHNSQPATAALFEELTKELKNFLNKGGLPKLGNHYFIALENNQTFIVLPTENLRWGILVATDKINLGLLFNIAIPNALKNLQAAING